VPPLLDIHRSPVGHRFRVSLGILRLWKEKVSSCLSPDLLCSNLDLSAPEMCKDLGNPRHLPGSPHGRRKEQFDMPVPTTSVMSFLVLDSAPERIGCKRCANFLRFFTRLSTYECEMSVIEWLGKGGRFWNCVMYRVCCSYPDPLKLFHKLASVQSKTTKAMYSKLCGCLGTAPGGCSAILQATFSVL
jgi:hypothetical protein